MNLEKFLTEHAIAPDVGGSDRYVRFERGDVDFVRSFFEDFDTSTQRLGATVADQSGGFIIVRRGWRQNVPPQLRPDVPVFTSNLRRPSYHPSKLDAKPWFTKKGQRVLPLRGGQLERHLAKWHADGKHPQGLHFHRRAAKYVLPPGAHGKRLDVPMPQRVLEAEIVFFVIEGSLKTDAILSMGAAAFGVPSVTLWDAPELDEFIDAMRLRDKPLVIVPDADWVSNPLVVTQAMLCRTYLRDRGVYAVIAAPPLANGAVVQKGVDDFLAAGGELDDLSILEREPCGYGLAMYAVTRLYHHAKQARAFRAIQTLPLYADASGALDKSVQAFATIIGRGGEKRGPLDRKSVRACIEDLRDLGVIEVEGDLAAGFQWEDPDTGRQVDYDWDERPRITFAPEFRAADRLLRLGDCRKTLGRALQVATEHAGGRTTEGAASPTTLPPAKHEPTSAEEAPTMTHDTIPTDHRLAADALRLHEITTELGDLAKRLIVRFPGDADVASAVDRFLATIPAD